MGGADYHPDWGFQPLVIVAVDIPNLDPCNGILAILIGLLQH